MSRRMSCSLSVDAVKRQIKTVTRRHIDTWTTLKSGDRLTLIEKGMGLPKGARQVVLTDVVVVSNRVETLRQVTGEECEREGFAHMEPREFRRFWAKGHGYGTPEAALIQDLPCRRIEFRYPADVAIPLKDIGSHPALDYDNRITAAAIVIEETAVMEALVIVNGRDHGYRKYCEFGGNIRFIDGEPCLMWPSVGLTFPTFGVPA